MSTINIKNCVVEEFAPVIAAPLMPSVSSRSLPHAAHWTFQGFGANGSGQWWQVWRTSPASACHHTPCRYLLGFPVGPRTCTPSQCPPKGAIGCLVVVVVAAAAVVFLGGGGGGWIQFAGRSHQPVDPVPLAPLKRWPHEESPGGGGGRAQLQKLFFQSTSVLNLNVQ